LTQFRQPLHQGGELSPPLRIALARTQEDADPPHALALLRTRRERPRNRCAAEQRDELAPFPLMEMHPIPSRAESTS